MTGADRERLAALEQQVAALTADLERYRRDACTIRMLNEMGEVTEWAREHGLQLTRPRHLHVVRGAR